MILFDLNFTLANSNYLQCDCYIDDLSTCGNGITFRFPTWVPGSYLIRDFSRFISGISVESNGQPLNFSQEDKTTWSIEPCNNPVKISYKIYLFDTSPRSGYLDEARLFFDGCRVFIQVDNMLEAEHQLSICAWKEDDKVYTTMLQKTVDNSGFGLYTAKNYWDLIEHPFAVGDFQCIEFKVNKVPHSCVIMDADIAFDQDRLRNDVVKACEGQVKFWKSMPIDRYIFFLGVEPQGYGGIEHTYSSSLLCSYNQLPYRTTKKENKEYISLLGLFSHEYLHVWNVKRLRPEVFVKPDLSGPVYTEQLWIFEGITSYYDDLNLMRAGIIEKKKYLELLENNFNRLLINYGRCEQSLAESSFDAWTKFYQPGENSVNAITSYYLKGSIVALMLDLKIISETQGKYSLQDVMLSAWQKYYVERDGLPEAAFEELADQVTGLDLKNFFNTMIRSTQDLDYKYELEKFGIEFNIAKDNKKAAEYLGVVLKPGPEVIIKNIINSSPARDSGLCPNDEIISVNGYRAKNKTINTMLANIADDSNAELLIARQGKVIKKDLSVMPSSGLKRCKLKNIEENKLQNTWLKVYG
ncbi:MAG: PDZ domain-containing protein [Francisellaceae bacterium]|nr:PDZ domain-containing protein [Francisellaceae bacterium]